MQRVAWSFFFSSSSFEFRERKKKETAQESRRSRLRTNRSVEFVRLSPHSSNTNAPGASWGCVREQIKERRVEASLLKELT